MKKYYTTMMQLKKSSMLFFALLFASNCALLAQQATWIWYPGDFEVWLGNKMQNRRTERGSFLPPFWKLDNHYVCVEFSKSVELLSPEEIEVFAEGEYNVKLDSKLISPYSNRIELPVGKHKINIKVFCQDRVPAIFLNGKTLVSDSSWKVTFEDKEWIDETGKVSDVSATNYLQAAGWNFNSPNTPPSKFSLNTIAQNAVAIEKKTTIITG